MTHALPLTWRQIKVQHAEQRREQRHIGDALRGRMRTAGVTRAQMAAFIGVSPTALDRFTSGVTFWPAGVEDFAATVNAAISALEEAA